MFEDYGTEWDHEKDLNWIDPSMGKPLIDKISIDLGLTESLLYKGGRFSLEGTPSVQYVLVEAPESWWARRWAWKLVLLATMSVLVAAVVISIAQSGHGSRARWVDTVLFVAFGSAAVVAWFKPQKLVPLVIAVCAALGVWTGLARVFVVHAGPQLDRWLNYLIWRHVDLSAQVSWPKRLPVAWIDLAVGVGFLSFVAVAAYRVADAIRGTYWN